MRGSLPLEPKVNFDVGADLDRYAALLARHKFPLLNGLDRPLVQSGIKAPNHADIVRAAVLPNLDSQNDCSLMLCFAGLFGVFRLDLVGQPGR